MTLFIDDRRVGEGRVERTQPLPFASDEPLEIGTDTGSPVTRDYSVHRFTGDVHWVDIEIPTTRVTRITRYLTNSGSK